MMIDGNRTGHVSAAISIQISEPSSVGNSKPLNRPIALFLIYLSFENKSKKVENTKIRAAVHRHTTRLRNGSVLLFQGIRSKKSWRYLDKNCQVTDLQTWTRIALGPPAEQIWKARFDLVHLMVYQFRYHSPVN